MQWSGTEIHRRVGERVVKSSVTRLTDDDHHNVSAGRSDDDGAKKKATITQCFEVPFTILDVNECILEENDPWRHVCPTGSICVNTPGSYECVCPLLSGEIGVSFDDDATTDNGSGATTDSFWKSINTQSRSPWEVSYPSSQRSSCPEKPSTYQCCNADGHSVEGIHCRSMFHCPTDPCSKQQQHNCSSEAKCQRMQNPLDVPGYLCVCPEGTWGNGRECSSASGSGGEKKKQKIMLPKVKFDGVTPTEETRSLLNKGLICGCQRPVVDVCSGFECHGE